MIYRIVIPESVYEELNEVALYYESKQNDLGVKFISDWEGRMKVLQRSPLSFQKKSKNYRSIQLKKFPYLLMYEVEGTTIYIYHIIHGKKQPGKVYKK